MRIGIDARMYGSSFTGIGRYVFELVKNLLEIDRENFYVFFLNPEGYATWEHKRGKKVLVDAPIYSLREQTTFLQTLHAAKLDLMHFTNFNAPVFYRRPSVVTIHDLTISLFPGNKRTSWLHRKAYNRVMRSIIRRAKRIIAVSEHTAKDLIRLMGAKREKISVIHEGVDVLFHRITDQHILDEFLKRMDLKQPFLLYTGVWRSHKNLVNLIKAFAILKRKHLFPGILVTTGKEDPWYPEVKETVRKEHLEGFIRFVGLVSDADLVLLYNTAAAYVYPSLNEGFGLPALEAFACGTPLCASGASSLPEICGEGNALFFNPHDPEDIANAIARVYNDAELREQLIHNGLERVKNFSWRKMAEETLEIYVHSGSKIVA